MTPAARIVVCRIPDETWISEILALMDEALEPTIVGYEIGALSTGEHHFYDRLGWERWRGRTFVRSGAGLIRTEDEDEGIMVLRTPLTPGLSLEWDITCESRPGDDW